MLTARDSIFASQTFRRYFIGQAFSYVGDGLRLIAIPLLVFHLTKSAVSLGFTYVLEILPFALAGLVGGSLADRVDRKRLMIWCDFVRFLIIVTFGVTYWTNTMSLPLLYGGIVVLSICAALFLGGQSSSIPYMIGQDRSTKAVAALIAAEQASNSIAPPLGAALLGLLGPVAVFAINASTYLASQVSLLLVPSLGPEKTDGFPDVSRIAKDIGIGFRFMLGDRCMRAVTVMSLCLNTFGWMGMAVVVPFLKRDFAASDQLVGVFYGIGNVACVGGALYAGRMSERWTFGRALTVAYVVDALVFLPIPFTHSYWLAVLCWALANGGAQFEITQIVGWRLRITPQDMVGRVFGAVRLVALGGIVPGALIGGYVADHYGARLAMLISAFGYLAIAAVAVGSRTIRDERR
ncbi:MAG: MFS transporter [Candidatus Eremiobacteraeota bacterium]|nr:MFS transporter [Candidatus Eremiobacteraeota bacterium]